MLPHLAAQKYKQVQVKTSSPGQLLVLLYEGLFRFLGEARASIEKGDVARAGERIDRAHAILVELVAGLNPKYAPELCDNLQGIYTFCMAQLVEANIKREVGPLDAVTRVLSPLRDAWKEAVAKAGSDPAPPPAP